MAYDPTKDPHLATWKERISKKIQHMKCPQCKKRGYKPYIYPDGEIVDVECGRCDHESSCGYHVTPKDWFKDHKADGDHTNKDYKEPEPPPRITISMDIVNRHKSAAKNTLLNYWKQKVMSIPDEPTRGHYWLRLWDAVHLFFVGTIDNDTIWWIADDHLQVRSGKIMTYLPNGHRDKTKKGARWIHNLKWATVGNPEGAEYVGCLYGLHQLRESAAKNVKQVQIVESEKTAVLMSMFKPNMTWMSTMGIAALNYMNLKPISDRGIPIVCHPDKDGYSTWEKKVRELKEEHPEVNISISNYVKDHWCQEMGDHADILDEMEYEFDKAYLNNEATKD